MRIVFPDRNEYIINGKNHSDNVGWIGFLFQTIEAMTKFESGVKHVQASQEAVYAKLSDLNNLEQIRERIPEDKVKNLSFDSESVSIEVDPVGKITLQIVEKNPCKCIKFDAAVSPLPFNLWIQLAAVSNTECKMKLTISMDLNPFMKTMVQKPLQDGLERMADALSIIPY